MPKKSLYIPSEIDALISAGEAESYSKRCAFLISMAVEMLLANTPELRLGEWCAIADAMNGTHFMYEMGPKGLVHSAWHGVYDSAPECNEKWGVDCEELSKRLRGMTLAEQFAVFEIGRSFWRRRDITNGKKTYQELFQALGARISPDD